jgi:hypothetical protein
MDEVIEQVMSSAPIQSSLNGLRREELRARVGSYIATLSSAGQRDVNQLTEFGLAYLRALREGPDPRYTGC